MDAPHYADFGCPYCGAKLVNVGDFCVNVKCRRPIAFVRVPSAISDLPSVDFHGAHAQPAVPSQTLLPAPSSSPRAQHHRMNTSSSSPAHSSTTLFVARKIVNVGGQSVSLEANVAPLLKRYACAIAGCDRRFDSLQTMVNHGVMTMRMLSSLMTSTEMMRMTNSIMRATLRATHHPNAQTHTYRVGSPFKRELDQIGTNKPLVSMC